MRRLVGWLEPLATPAMGLGDRPSGAGGGEAPACGGAP